MQSDDDPAPALPELDETDVVAIEGILIRTIRAQDQLLTDREMVKVLNARIASNNAIRSGAYDALKIFGFVETPDTDSNLWDLVRHTIGTERYRRTIAFARGEELPLLAQMGDQSLAEEANEGALFGDSAEAFVVRKLPVRAAILEYLHAAGARGVKASEAKKYLADAHGITVHDKTPGMTLYRLLKDGLARREGRTWFAVAQDGNNEIEAPSGNSASASQPALAAQ